MKTRIRLRCRLTRHGVMQWSADVRHSQGYFYRTSWRYSAASALEGIR
jgi:hypothetical protein